MMRIKQIVAGIVLLAVFIKEVIVANLQLAYAVLFVRNSHLTPGFLNYNLRGCSNLEMLILSHMITLTPGTTSVYLCTEKQELTIHAFNAKDPESVRSSIQKTLHYPLKRVLLS
ncbi:hypothetical protein CL648_01210 [bacterium]|jgi:multisubunit Na+/H+ antiporter MnhE subunit|nr:hypothetical protein [bacterium]|tara:strand:+ start:3433 stop:3774 length:342 start_codon:yes stop_codon:yes gene_type:complete